MKIFSKNSPFRTRAHSARPISLRQAYATWVIVIVNVLWFSVIETSRGFSTSGLISAGALTPLPHWYQYFSAMFVHLGLVHIGLNMYSLVTLYIVELILGSAAFTVLYLLSGVFGNLVFTWVTPGISAGASGAIFGVFGAALALSFLRLLPKTVRNQLLVVLALNLIYDFTQPGIGTAAHIGGLVAGLGLGAWFARYGKKRKLISLVAVVTSLGAGWALLVTLLN